MPSDSDEVLPRATLSSRPFIVDTTSQLGSVVRHLAAGHGPFGIDAERASGFRYSARAYLIQISRRGGGTHLIDPIALQDLGELSSVLTTDEWILHAATQDLSCLAEVGLRPPALFDTELGSRLAGLPRVGLQAVVAELLGLHLAKEHSAADWSTRPIPPEWLEYAALDVELLPDLRDALITRLKELDKLDIARQEFAHLLTWQPPEAKPDPWRRLSGIQTLSTPRQLAVARELWIARDEFAREIDCGPGRVLPDRAIVAAVSASPGSRGELSGLSSFTGRFSRRELPRWWAAIQRGLASADLPPMRLRGNGLSAPRNWRDKHPDSYARFVCVRTALSELSGEIGIPVENLLLPETIRKVCFAPPADISVSSLTHWLREAGARPWQLELIPLRLNDCFERVAKDPTPFFSVTSTEESSPSD